MQLVSKLQPREYMAFGLSKSDAYSAMNRADVAVTWIDDAGNGHAVDYFLSSKEQCVGNRGSCPDIKHPGATDSITLLHAAIVNGFSMVTFKRPQLGVDEEYDQHVYSDGGQAVIWAIGPLNNREEVSYHSIHNYGNTFIDFARTPTWNCPRPDESLLNQRRFQRLTAEATGLKFSNKLFSPSPQPPLSSEQHQKIKNITPSAIVNQTTLQSTSTTMSETTLATITTTTTTTTKRPNLQPWRIPQIRCPKERTLWAQIGPVGGSRGYQAITGRQGWGIAYYINGLLIPEIILKRGVTYTFLVEGGNDEANGARRHPLYLTDSAEGGYEFKSPTERAKERVFGGVGITSNGTILPTAQGRMCEFKITPATNVHDIAGTYDRFEDFQKTLMLDCDNGRPGVIKFTPDRNTPDIIYYQCFTHRFLGWKIRIVDDCNEDLEDNKLLHSASMINSIKIEPPPSSLPPTVHSAMNKGGEMTSFLDEVNLPIITQNRHVTKQMIKPQVPQSISDIYQQQLSSQYQQKFSKSSKGNPRPQQSQQPSIKQHLQHQRRPLSPSNQNHLSPNSQYSSSLFYDGENGSGVDKGFHKHQLNLLPHTILQDYHHLYQHHQLPQLPSPQQLNPYPNPLPQVQSHKIFNQQQQQNNFYHQAPNVVQTLQIQKETVPQQLSSSKLGHTHGQPNTLQQLQQPLLQFPMKKFGHRPPVLQSLNVNNLSHKQQIPYYGNSGPSSQHSLHKSPSHHHHSVIPLYYHHSQKSGTASLFGPTSTKPPLQGGFVPITLDSTSNRPPVAQPTNSQNVWFPNGMNHNQTKQQQLTTGSRLHKPTKYSKKPTMDIFRIVSGVSSVTSTINPITTTTATSTTNPPPSTASSLSPVDRNSEIETMLTTVVSSSPNPTTIRLVNDSSIEILTFVPMEQPVYNGSLSSSSPPLSSVAQTIAPYDGDFFTNKTLSSSSSLSPFINNDLIMNMDDDEIGEESERRYSVMSLLNGFEVLYYI